MDGKEQVLHFQNPWDSLGYQAAEEAITLFDGGDYQAAILVLDGDLPKIARADLKRELSSLRLLAEAYLAWDLFDHRKAFQKLGDAQRNANDLRHLLPARAEGMLQAVHNHRDFLSAVQQGLGRHFIMDLLANARRCAQRGRYDDAVARLYRAIEAIAQARLREKYGIEDTGCVAIDKVPEPLSSQWRHRAREGSLPPLGLQDDYQLLKALGDGLGQQFEEIGLTGKESPLSSRNQSILAHGFTPVGEKVFQELWDRTLKLASVAEAELPAFPSLQGE